MAAGRAGVGCKLFNTADEVPAGERAFVRLDQQAEQRALSKGMVASLAARGVITLPTAEEAQWYDDKLAQLAVIGHHMPRTLLLKDTNTAVDSMRRMSLPFVSKAREGAASANVRLIRTAREAEEEIKLAFTAGISISGNRRQKGYLLWQDFVAGNECDYRVCVVGERYFGLVRQNRADLPFASGSGNFRPLTLSDERERVAFAKAVALTKELGTQLMAYDLVFDAHRPLVLEMSSSWKPYAYALCPAFDEAGKPTGEYGGEMFDWIVRALC